jgi:ubiquinone/menaquinone biosynthesis C-methylase UbiE
MNPNSVVEDIDIRAGDKVLEIGMPVGFFAPALLNKVGVDGMVYVAGPNRESFEKLGYLKERKNLSFKLLADILMGGAIPEDEIDIVVLTNLLSNTLKPDAFCLAIGKYLKPGGEIVVIDWDNKIKNVGPSMERRVTKEEALRLMHSCGMQFKRILKLPGYHYGMVFSFKR